MIPEVEVPINSPTPQEFFFRGEVDREKNCVSIFLEDGNDYIRVGFKSPISEFENSISIFDNYFQEWIVWGDYLVLTDLVNSELITVKPELITALGIAQTERWEEVSPHLRTHRLLPVDQENLRFRFTTDKSDLLRKKVTLPVNRNFVSKEEVAAQAKARSQKLAEADAKADVQRELLLNNKELIKRIVKAVMSANETSADDIKRLHELGILETTTTFRMSTYGGERFLLSYSFLSENGVTFAGFIGFDKDLRPIILDKRIPVRDVVSLPVATTL